MNGHLLPSAAPLPLPTTATGPLPLGSPPRPAAAKVSAGSAVHGTEPGLRWVPPARQLRHRPATYLQPASSPRPLGSPSTAS